MIKILLKTLIILLLTLNSNNNISPKEQLHTKENKQETIGNIIINKINLNKPLYPINNNKNNIEENIQILKESILPPNKNSIIFLAAHSGTSNISYFNKLNQLKINDIINLTINNKDYIYIIKDIYKQKKNGYININKEKNNQLILTTCDPINDKYQLIINCIEKEFN